MPPRLDSLLLLKQPEFTGDEIIEEKQRLWNVEPPGFVPQRFMSKERKPHIVDWDMSGGQELYPVPVFNSNANRMSVAPFKYVTTIEMPSNYTRTPVACGCVDGCDSKCPCMEEPYNENVSEPAYKKGRLQCGKMKADWGDDNPQIWECGDHCKCGPECPTRSAQFGLRFSLEVYLTSKKGWGVRAIHTIPKGSFIAEYAGKLRVAGNDDEPITDNNWYSFQFDSNEGTTDFFIDATENGNVSRFFNHSCNPNMFAARVFFDDNNPVMGMHICFYANREIRGERYITSTDDENGQTTIKYQRGEEMTFDYGSGYWAGKLLKGQGCECSEKTCKFRLPKTWNRKRKATDGDLLKQKQKKDNLLHLQCFKSIITKSDFAF